MASSGTDPMELTRTRVAARKLDIDFEIHHDPQWTYSTVSASFPDKAVLGVHVGYVPGLSLPNQRRQRTR